MQTTRDLAIVLKTVAFEERHRIVTALTEKHGLVSALARNSIQSRRFGGSLDAFSAAEWTFVLKPGSDLCRLDEAQIRRSFEGLRKDFERLSLASVFSELMIRLAPQHDPCPELFRLHANSLATLEEMPSSAPSDILALLNAYLAKVLQWSGNQPQLGACLHCQKPLEQVSGEFGVSCLVPDAGWMCSGCRVEETRHVRGHGGQVFQHAFLRLTPNSIRDFQAALAVPIRLIPSHSRASLREQQDLFKFLEALFVYHVPGFDQQPLKSLRFLDLESTVPPPAAHPR